MKGRLVIISAPSGAGKSTIVNHLLEMNLKLEFSVSATTRKPRGKEEDGKEYYFLSLSDFRDKIAGEEFIEWEEVYEDQMYGTLKSEIERIWSKGSHVLFDVDVKGGITLKSIFRNKAIAIFIMPPSVGELERRLITRGTDSAEKIKMRVAKAEEEITLAGKFDNIIINDNLDQAKGEAFELVSNFLKK